MGSLVVGLERCAVVIRRNGGLPGPGQRGLREELGSPPLLLSSPWEGKWGLQESALSGDLICASMSL